MAIAIDHNHVFAQRRNATILFYVRVPLLTKTDIGARCARVALARAPARCVEQLPEPSTDCDVGGSMFSPKNW